MTEAPTFTLVTEDLYDRLPAVHREQDRAGALPWILKRWISGMGDQVGEIVTLLQRIDYYPPDEADPEVPSEGTSDLADADVADLAWLPWIGQLVGAQVDAGLSETAQRDVVRQAVSGFRAGTKAAIIEAARSELTGERYVRLDDHTGADGVVGAGGEFEIMLTTLASETPDEAGLVAAIIRKGAKPAGLVINHRTATTTWDTLEANRPTWNDWDGQTWVGIEETGL